MVTTEKSKLKIAKDKLKLSSEREFATLLDTIIELENSVRKWEDKLQQTVAKSENLCYTELKALAEVFCKLSVSDKNKVAREIFEKIVISQGEIGIFLKMK